MGRDTWPCGQKKRPHVFQSTRPRGARPKGRWRLRRPSCFNPRAHVGRDFLFVILSNLVLVSIHAPTWGATADRRTSMLNFVFQSTRPRGARRTGYWVETANNVSIHAPTWGATFIRENFKGVMEFQSTRPRGARRESVDLMHKFIVSIHAPTWGATA